MYHTQQDMLPWAELPASLLQFHAGSEATDVVITDAKRLVRVERGACAERRVRSGAPDTSDKEWLATLQSASDRDAWLAALNAARTDD